MGDWNYQIPLLSHHSWDYCYSSLRSHAATYTCTFQLLVAKHKRLFQIVLLSMRELICNMLFSFLDVPNDCTSVCRHMFFTIPEWLFLIESRFSDIYFNCRWILNYDFEKWKKTTGTSLNHKPTCIAENRAHPV